MLYAGTDVAAALALGDVRHNLSTRSRLEVLAPPDGLEMEWAGIPHTRTSGVNFVFTVGSCGHAPEAGQQGENEPAHFVFPDPWRGIAFSEPVPDAFKFSLE